MRVKIAGVGMAVPGHDGVLGQRVTNKDFAKQLFDAGNAEADRQEVNDPEARAVFLKNFTTSDEWITNRTGIRERCFADPRTATSDLATIAAQRAMECAGIDPMLIGRLDLATVTPDHPATPPTFAIVANNLGLGRTIDGGHGNLFGADTSSACSSFIAGLQNSYAAIGSGMVDCSLAVGADVMSRIVDRTDRGFSVILGDGAGAFLLQTTTSDSAFEPRGFTFGADGRYAERIIVRAGGSRYPTTHEAVNRGDHFLWMDGRAVFKEVVSLVYSDRDPHHSIIGRALLRAKKNLGFIEIMFFHQANLRMVNAIESELRRSGYRGLIYNNVDHFGNTTSAAIPLLMAEARMKGVLVNGMTFMAVVFGGGYTWGTVMGKWTVPNP